MTLNGPRLAALIYTDVCTGIMQSDKMMRPATERRGPHKSVQFSYDVVNNILITHLLESIFMV